MDSTSTSHWWDRLFITGLEIHPIAIAQAVAVVVLAWAVSRLVRYLLHRSRAGQHIEPAVRYSIGRLIHYSLLVFGMLLGIRMLGVDMSSLALVAGALSVGIGFGLQSIVANVVSGLVLLFERPIRVGDRVSLGTLETDATGTINGYVRNIGLRATAVVTPDNISLIVPNSEFLQRTIVNWSLGNPAMRLRVNIGVAYGSDIDKVREIIERVALEQPETLNDPPPEVRVVGTGDSSLDFQLLAWIGDPRRRGVVDGKLREGMVKEFREAGIQIPFPQRDVHMISSEPK